MKTWKAVAVCLALALSVQACASTTEAAEAEELAGVDYLNRCYFQSLSFPFTVVGEESFMEMQETISSVGVEALDADQAWMLSGLTQPIRSRSATFEPERTATAVVPGTTTAADFRNAVGLREYVDYMSTISRRSEDSEVANLRTRFADQLDLMCETHEADFLAEACTAGDSEACRLVDNLDQLDPAVVAEACELTPYMLFCDPEDPIPWELPPLEE